MKCGMERVAWGPNEAHRDWTAPFPFRISPWRCLLIPPIFAMRVSRVVWRSFAYRRGWRACR